MTGWLAAAVLLAAAMVASDVEDAVASSRAGTSAAVATPTEPEAKSIFYALIKQRVAAVEQTNYSLIEPLYAHDEGLLVLRPNLALRGWKAVQGYWQKSMSVRRSEPFRVYYNDDLVVTVAGDLIVGALTWSNQGGQRPRNYGCLSLTLRRQGERWVIVQEHSSNWAKPSP